MTVDYIQPLVDAWNRMVEDLFRPFRIGRWFAVGLMVFLVQCSKGGGGGGNVNVPSGGRGRDFEEQMRHAGGMVRDWFDSPIIIPIIVSLIVVLLALWLVFLWLGSRAHLVFLDQLAHRHWRIAEPWERTRAQGNSLFLWRLGFTLIVIAGVLVIILPVVLAVIWAARKSEFTAVLMALGLGVPVFLAFIVPVAFIECFLSNFVIPIMYKDGVKTTEGWRRFMPLLRAHFWKFVAYGLLIFVLAIGVGVMLFVIGCATCCVGFVLFIIPYIGSVVTLPIHYTWRGFGPNFLAQFGPEYWQWPEAAVAAPAGIPPPTPPPEPGPPVEGGGTEPPWPPEGGGSPYTG